MGRARENKLFSLIFYKLNNFSKKRFKQVDDKAYGMHGQVISPEPLAEAMEFVFKKVGRKIPVIYMTPRGKVLTQSKVEYLYRHIDECIILCGHYEWIDERIVEMYVDYQISIGKYILSSGEIAAQVLIDALVRHIPNVLWNTKSLEEESFSQKLGRKKEYPVYTRPQNFKWKQVPSVLVSGNHEAIEQWKYSQLW